MDEPQTCNGKPAGFAVVRNYAPARIEHELLARVLELVGPAAARDRMQAADMFDQSLPAVSTVTGSESIEHQHQPHALEPAA